MSDNIDSKVDSIVDKALESEVIDEAPDTVDKEPSEKEETFKTSDLVNRTGILGGDPDDDGEKPNPLANIMAGVTHIIQNMGEDIQINEEDIEQIESYSHLFESLSKLFEKLEKKKRNG